jgi:hypothetical protein
MPKGRESGMPEVEMWKGFFDPAHILGRLDCSHPGNVVEFGKLRDLLQGDVGVASQVLKALVGDVVIETRQVEEQEKPQMVARFTINAVPALAVLDRGRSSETAGTSWPAACSEQPDGLAGKATPKEVVVPLKRKCHRAGGDPPVTPPTDSQPPKA